MDQAHPAGSARIGVGLTNPSVCEDFVLLRKVNYDLSEGFVRPPDSKNFIGRLRDRTAESLSLIEDSPRPLIYRNGLEDGRLIRWNGRLYGLFSGHYQSEGRWVVFRNTMVLMDLETLEYRTFPTQRREKNWMPFVEDGHLRVVYSTSPLIIWDLSERLPEVVWEGPGLTEFWSGGSQLIPYQGGFLGVVHRHFNRVYEHAFVGLNGRSIELSPPFRFFGESVEFCAGIEDLGNEILLSFGVMDRDGYICWIPKSARAGTGL